MATNEYYANLSCPIQKDKPIVTSFNGTVRARCHLCGYNSIVLEKWTVQMSGRDTGKPWWNGMTHYCVRGRLTNVAWIDGE